MATVLKTYNLTDISSGTIKPRKLEAEIRAAGYVENFWGMPYDVTTGNIVIEGDSLLNETALDALVAAHEEESLAEYKALKNTAIDERTRELIEGGFSYNSKTFSLSQEAQAKLTGINQIRTEGDTSYPIKWNTIDDQDVESLSNAGEVLQFYKAAVSAYRGHVDSGTSLKDSVRAATTKAEVDAVTDAR